MVRWAHSIDTQVTPIVVVQRLEFHNQTREAVTLSDDRSRLFLKLPGEVKVVEGILNVLLRVLLFWCSFVYL